MVTWNLRQLLAYLDDSLPPAEARQVGHLLAEDPKAQRLVERIKMVIRRRRLAAVSPDPDAADLDANLVAEYLDQKLDESKQQSLENMLLDSDLLLAEVACVHQVISMGAIPAVELDERTRERFDSLGGHVVPRSETAKDKKKKKRKTANLPLLETQLIPLALPAYASSKNRWAKGLTAVGSIVLLVGLVAAVWSTLRPPSFGVPIAEARVQPTKLLQKPVTKLAIPPAVEPPAGGDASVPIVDKSKTTETVPGTKSAEKGAVEAKDVIKPTNPIVESTEKKASPATEKGPVLASAAPAMKPETKPSAVVKSVESANPEAKSAKSSVKAELKLLVPSLAFILRTPEPVLLKFNEGPAVDEMVVVPEGERVELLASDLSITLVDQTRFVATKREEGGLTLRRLDGRVLLQNKDRATTVSFGDDTEVALVQLSGKESQIAIESQVTNPLSQDRRQGSVDRVYLLTVIQGEPTVSFNSGQLVLKAGQQVRLDVKEKSAKPTRPTDLPGWISRERTTSETRATEALLANLRDKRRIRVTLREMLEDRTKEIRRASVRALAAIEDFDGLSTGLGNRTYGDVRNLAHLSIRPLVGGSPASLDKFRAALQEDYRAESASNLLDLVLGFSAKSLAELETYEKLVSGLESEELAVRELSIFHLKEITGRDQGFAADAPAARRKSTVTRWRDWLSTQTPATLPPKRIRSSTNNKQPGVAGLFP